MNNLLDYLAWRGDLSLSAAPFCEADYPVLCRLAYIPWNAVCGNGVPVPLAEAAAALRARIDAGDPKAALALPEDARLLGLIGDSPRFGALRIVSQDSVTDTARQEQFFAFTLHSPAERLLLVSFRGTDGTIVGWKEDLNMAFADAVPAQKDAARYLERVALGHPDCRIRLCGHSKGGNLAVYASAMASPGIQARIDAVRSLDGPGFNERTVRLPGFQRMLDRTMSYVPQGTVVGLLLGHEERFSVVHSSGKGLGQHDLYTWEIRRDRPAVESTITGGSRFLDRTLTRWVEEMGPDEREKMIDALFSLLADADAVTIADLLKPGNLLPVLRSAVTLKGEARGDLTGALKKLPGAVRETLSQPQGSAGEELP